MVINRTLRSRLASRPTPNPDSVRVDALQVVVRLDDKAGRTELDANVCLLANEIAAEMVQSCLDARGLVMAPRGKDFMVPVERSAGR